MQDSSTGAQQPVLGKKYCVSITSVGGNGDTVELSFDRVKWPRWNAFKVSVDMRANEAVYHSVAVGDVRVPVSAEIVARMRSTPSADDIVKVLSVVYDATVKKVNVLIEDYAKHPMVDVMNRSADGPVMVFYSDVHRLNAVMVDIEGAMHKTMLRT